MERSVELVKQLISEGKSIRDMAKIFGIAYSPMRLWMKKRGLQSPFSPGGERKWSDEDLRNAVKESNTIADVLRYLGLSTRPGNYLTVKKYCNILSIDISDFIGKNHGNTKPGNKYTHEDAFCENSTLNRSNLKRRIIKDNLIQYCCEICGQDEYWNHSPLVLILDHKNGINNDNRISNLRFLCPNCNSQQDTFCRSSITSDGRGSG